LLTESVIHPEDWERLPESSRQELLTCPDSARLLADLVKLDLLTEYQAVRIEATGPGGLVLGNYRVLERLGAGSTATVFKAEHLELRRLVAVKVPTLREADGSVGSTDPAARRSGDQPCLEGRFTAEMRAVARLQHSNIAAAIDAGRTGPPNPLRYFVMEYVPGQDLERHVRSRGQMPVTLACDVIHQVASALAEAHRHQLVHRDIKPSNIRLTPEGQAKLLDFGLARDWNNRLTQPGIVLGTLDYMAPEQAADAGNVDIRADLFALGGTLYWCLTGEVPFPDSGGFLQALSRRLTQSLSPVRRLRPDVPLALEDVLRRLMAVRPEDRYPDPQAVLWALLPFLHRTARATRSSPALPVLSPAPGNRENEGEGKRQHRVLVVDDSAEIRMLSRFTLEVVPLLVDEAGDGKEALAALASKPYDLVLLDVHLPDVTGLELCRRLRQNPPAAHLKVVLFSGEADPDALAQALLDGADDFLSKPFTPLQLQARVQAALRLKDSQVRADLLNRHLLAINHELEEQATRSLDTAPTHGVLTTALSEIAALRGLESSGHLRRLPRYCRRLATEAARLPALASQIDANFIEMLECCAPLHDIGNAALPDHLMLKPDLTEEDRLVMQAHTTSGAEALERVARQHPFAAAFLQMAIDIVRHHHERYDGKGYPDCLAGESIPLAARLMALADVYDALRSRRPYKPALSHSAALAVMGADGKAGQFDPSLFEVFLACAGDFERIYRECPD
jgi:response regulator RpfG family c-di-GMP phosphodiesterase